MKKIILLMWYSVFSFVMYAEDMYTFQTKNEGLLSLSISAIAQDCEGFLWFASAEGITMYDGKGFVPYTSVPFQKNSLSSTVVQTMLMEKSGDMLWVGTYLGLDAFNIKTKTFTHYILSNDVVVSLLSDSKGRLWAGTLNGLNLLNRETGAIKVYNNMHKGAGYIGNNTTRGLYEDSKGIIYAVTYDGLFEYDEKTDSFVKSHLLIEGNPALSGTVYSIYEDTDGSYWISSWLSNGGLIHIDGETKEFTVFPLPDNRIYVMNFDFDPNVILLGSWGSGLYVFDKKTANIVQYTIDSVPPSNISNNTIYSLFKDSSGILWIGTNGGGINVYDPNRSMFKSISSDVTGISRIPIGRTRDILLDYEGNIWIAVTNSGIAKYNIESGAINLYQHNPDDSNSLVSNMVHFLYSDSKQKIWIGTNEGLASYNPKTDSFVHEKWFQHIENTLEQTHTYTMIEALDGSLWVGTYNNGVTRFYPNTGKYEQYKHISDNPNSLSNNVVYFIGQDSYGHIWIGTNNGLNRYLPESNSFQVLTYDMSNPLGLSSNTVLSFLEDTDGNVWFATRAGGLSVLKAGWTMENLTVSFTHYTTQQGLSSDTVNALASARNGKIWVATQNGLCLVDAYSGAVTTYGKNDGLISQQFNLGSAVTKDGTIYFGTPEGLVYFNGIETSLYGLQSPSVAITNFFVNSLSKANLHSGDFKKPILLDSTEKNIEIHFTSMDFSPLNRPIYTYKLEGFDEKWSICGDRNYVSYTNLPSGAYTFWVKTYAADESEYTGVSHISFSISTPFFMRWYMCVLYAAVVFVLFYMIMRIRDSLKLRKKVQELEETKEFLESANGELQNLSYNDALTGISNRRFFEMMSMNIWESSLIHNKNISFCMIDIDFFKSYNDTYGHLEGDKALTLVATTLKKCLYRSGDIVARYGGEEFVVLIADVLADNAFLLAERMRQEVMDLKIPAACGREKYLTISVGLFCAVPLANKRYTDFIAKADEFLYKAKLNGRNCVCY